MHKMTSSYSLFEPEPAQPTIKLTPRKYQLDAFAALQTYLEYRDGNPCIVLPTGAGKSLVMAMICEWVSSWDGRVMVLAHVKELLEQTASTLKKLDNKLDIGVYSAGLNLREKRSRITIAGIQSVHSKAREFEPFDMVLIDEAHMIPPSGEGMYRTFLTDARKLNTNLRIVGLTATPYRLGTGMLCGPYELLNNICYEISVSELIKQGYLCPLLSKRGGECDTSGLHISKGEFNAEEVEILMSNELTVRHTVKTILEKTLDRNSVLVFCSSVEHAKRVMRELRGGDDLFAEPKYYSVSLITGDTPSDERAETLAKFKSREIKYLVNVNVLTTGFDAPNVDCVCLLRPTLSPGLYYQMVGRGFRLHESKQNTLVLDFGNNIKRHGPVDSIRIERTKSGSFKLAEIKTKICPECDEVVVANTRECACGYLWPEPEKKLTAKHDFKADHDTGILSGGEPEPEITEHPVYEVRYSVHQKKDAPPDHPKTLKVEYITVPLNGSGGAGLISQARSYWQQRHSTITEWVCVEHDPGFALSKAKLWWAARSNDPFPRSAQRAADMGLGGSLAMPKKVFTKPDPKNPKYTVIVRVELGEKPEPIEVLCECKGAGCVLCEFDFRDMAQAGSTSQVDDEWGEVPF